MIMKNQSDVDIENAKMKEVWEREQEDKADMKRVQWFNAKMAEEYKYKMKEVEYTLGIQEKVERNLNTQKHHNALKQIEYRHNLRLEELEREAELRCQTIDYEYEAKLDFIRKVKQEFPNDTIQINL